MTAIRYLPYRDPERIRRLWSGAVMRVLRQRGPWTQDALARRLGVSDSTWSRLEQGTVALEADPLALAEDCLGVERGSSLHWGILLASLHGERTGTSAWRFRRAEELIPPSVGKPGHRPG